MASARQERIWARLKESIREAAGSNSGLSPDETQQVLEAAQEEIEDRLAALKQDPKE